MKAKPSLRGDEMLPGHYPECEDCQYRYFDMDKNPYCELDFNPQFYVPDFCPYPKDLLEREDEFGQRI